MRRGHQEQPVSWAGMQVALCWSTGVARQNSRFPRWNIALAHRAAAAGGAAGILLGTDSSNAKQMSRLWRRLRPEAYQVAMQCASHRQHAVSRPDHPMQASCQEDSNIIVARQAQAQRNAA